ncbi:MAG: hypothetical protein JO270_05820 [Acidobacteriaceae bacterium]|nr:hypothetical protein [Acidobacteriaceae bacterium]MBV8569647.1 hypothetical protein [Acidobacteriaceae bacterium]
MNNVSPFAIPGQEVSSAQSDVAGVHPDTLDQLIHELRQPLSVIESLAYYLELTVSDNTCCTHLQKIRLMLLKAHAILEQASGYSRPPDLVAHRRSLVQGH